MAFKMNRIPARTKSLTTKLKQRTTRLSVEGPIECSITGSVLLNNALYNKGTAFKPQEREEFNLKGLLPERVNSLDEQVERAYQQFRYLKTPLARNDFCTSMRRQNLVLYFALVGRNIKEMLPIIYTPTEGDAIMAYSERFRKPEGCFLDIKSPETIEERLSLFGSAEDIDYIVVSDGEGILGIGDQGVGGVRISVAKLGLMTLCGGIHPGRVLPVALDVGTDNKRLLEDPLYVGNRFPRVRGKEYWEFIDKFVHAVKKFFPKAVLHYEDFGVSNAKTMLEKYRGFIPSFNDDIQGTGSVVMASLIAALKYSSKNLEDCKVLIYGAGSAGLGVANQIYKSLVISGTDPEKAKGLVHLMDKKGLIKKSDNDASEGQKLFAKEDKDWEGNDTKSLLEVVKKVKPDVLVGCSTQPGSFTEEVIKEIYKHHKYPIVFPLSNPSRLHEAFPVDIMKWTENNALIATGSPFEPVDGIDIAENNNCYTFPGIGLSAVLSRSKTISDSMINAGIEQLASLSPRMSNPKAGLLPDIHHINEVSARVATAMILQALDEGVATVESENKPNGEKVSVPRSFNECLSWVKSQMWKAEYRPLLKTSYQDDEKTP